MNFWRYLYFCVDKDASKIERWTKEFDETGTVHFDEATFEAYKQGFLSHSVSDDETLGIIKEVFETEGYLMDPHTAVSLVAANALKNEVEGHKVICLATAHPAKFPEITLKALGCDVLPEAGTHPSLEKAKRQCQKGYTADHSHLEEALLDAMESHWEKSCSTETT